MALFTLVYRYTEDADRVTQHRPEHRAYLRSLAEQGHLLLAGPLGEAGPPGGLLVFEAESSEQVRGFADGDPFHRHGVIVETTVRSWTLSIGGDLIER